MTQEPFYDPTISYEENYTRGPFGAFVDGEKIQRASPPTARFFDFPVYIPFGIPAGPLINSRFVAAAFDKGFDIATYKTVRTRDYPCHPWPNVLAVHPDGNLSASESKPLIADVTYREPLSITNSFGVPSKDPDIWQEDMKRAVQSASEGQVMVGSFQGTSDGSGNEAAFISDFVLAARLVKETGAKVLEVNLSCPNEGTAHLLCFDLARTRRVVNAIKTEIGATPLIIKIAYFDTDKELEKLVRLVGPIVDGISAINTIPATIIDQDGNQALPGKGRERSGVCGAIIKWAGLSMVKRLGALRKKHSLSYTVIGVGGVNVAGDFAEYRNAGADVVMSATGAMWNPHVAMQIERSL